MKQCHNFLRYLWTPKLKYSTSRKSIILDLYIQDSPKTLKRLSQNPLENLQWKKRWSLSSKLLKHMKHHLWVKSSVWPFLCRFYNVLSCQHHKPRESSNFPGVFAFNYLDKRKEGELWGIERMEWKEAQE